MAFIERDSEGNISAIVRENATPDKELANPKSKEIVEFLYGDLGVENFENSWLAADLSLARVVEDLVDIMIKKGMLEITDFPILAQQKLISRRGKRSDYEYLTELFPADDDDELISD